MSSNVAILAFYKYHHLPTGFSFSILTKTTSPTSLALLSHHKSTPSHQKNCKMDIDRAGSDPPGKRKRNADDEDQDYASQRGEGSPDLLNFEDGDGFSDDEDDSENESDDDDDESITGPCEYEESSESYPRCAAFDKDFAQVGQDLVSIPSQIVEIVDSSGCYSRRAQSCRSNADDLARIPKAHREKIALLGNTGAGM